MNCFILICVSGFSFTGYCECTEGFRLSFFFSSLHHIEIELGSVLTINNALLALGQGFYFDCSDTMVNFSILTASWVYFESPFTSLAYISMLFHCMYLPPPHSHFSDAVLKTRNMLMGASLQLHQCMKGTFCVMSS